MAEVPAEGDNLEGRLRSGDEAALAELFARSRERLWRIVDFRLESRMRGRLDPDDVLQEAYLAAAQRLKHFRDAASMTPFVWLRAVTLQTLIDLHRHHVGAQRRNVKREVPIQGWRYPQATSASLAIHLVGDVTSPSGAASRAEAVEAVERAIEGMDPVDREVLALRHFEELTNTEVAETLGIQQKAASIRYVRALKRLKQILAETPGLFGEESGHA